VLNRLARSGCFLDMGPPVQPPVGQPGAQPQRDDPANKQSRVARSMPTIRLASPTLCGSFPAEAYGHGRESAWILTGPAFPPVTASLAPET
jgi:hypothetical protein